MKQSGYHQGLFILVTATMLACYFLMYLWTPYQIDDFIFAHYYRTANGGSEAFSLSALAKTVEIIRASENGRFANLLAGPWVLWMPKAIAALIMAATTYVMVYMVAGLTKRSVRPSAPLLTISWAFCAILLPWREYIFVADVYLNYVMASAILLLFIYFFIGAGRGRQNKPWHTALLMALALMAAWFHETAAIVAGAGLAAYAIQSKFRLTKGQWLMVICFAIGAAISISSPAIWERLVDAEAQQGEGRSILQNITIRGLLKALPATTLLIISLIGGQRQDMADASYRICLLTDSSQPQ